MSHIAQIDYISLSGKGFMHKAQPLVKMISALLFIGTILSLYQLEKVMVIFLITIALLIVNKIPFKIILPLLLYPLIFSSLFAFVAQGWPLTLRFTVVVKALSSAMTLLLLLCTTSQVDIFGILGRILPKLLVSILFFTYRTLFILSETFSHLLINIKLRGGYNPKRLIFNIKNITKIISVLLIHAYDMSQRMYQIYSFRGYSGKIQMQMNIHKPDKNDWFMILLTLMMMLGVLLPWNL